MDLGIVSEGLLIEPPQNFPLVLHGLLWDLLNIQVTKVFLKTLMRLLGIIPLLENLWDTFMVQ